MTKENEEIQVRSDSLAEIIVDAMIDAGLTAGENFKNAVSVASPEILARLACGDYPPRFRPERLTRND